MRRLFILPFYLFFLTLPARAENNHQVQIGVSVPLTGPGATYGQDVLHAIQLANEEIGHGKYELVVEDDACSPKEAATVAQRFTSGRSIRYVLGLPCSGTALAAAPIYQRTKTLLIASMPSAKEFSNSGDYIFRMRGDEGPVAELMAKTLREKFSRIGILSEQTEYAESMRKELAAKLGEVSVSSETFLSGVPDLRTETLRLTRKNIEVLVILAQSEIAASLGVKAIRELNRNLPIFGSNAFASRIFRELVKDNLNNLTVVSQPPVKQMLTEEGLRLYQRYEQQFGSQRSVEYSFYLSYESFHALTAAIESGREPRDYLQETKFTGIFGPYSFDENGDLQGIKPAIWSLDSN